MKMKNWRFYMVSKTFNIVKDIAIVLYWIMVLLAITQPDYLW